MSITQLPKPLAKYLVLQTGRRSDSAHAYIHSTMRNHENLYLMCNTKVDKVILEGDRAVGVQVVPTKPLHPGQVCEYLAEFYCFC